MNQANYPLVSVIVPVYNVEMYVECCLQSIAKQSYPRMEVIVVNDGATDRSPEICQDFCQKDGRFLLINQSNQGLSGARNTGIAAANGEFLVFVDADDQIEESLLMTAWQLADQHGVDLVTVSLNVGSTETPKTQYEDPQLGKISAHDALQALLQARFGSYICQLFIRRSIFTDHQIKFPVGRQFEDVATMYRLISKVKTCYLSGLPLYRYELREESITHQHAQHDLDDMLTTFEELEVNMRNYEPTLMEDVRRYESNLIYMLLIRMGSWDQGIKRAQLQFTGDEHQFVKRSVEVLYYIYQQMTVKWRQKKVHWLKLQLLKWGIFPYAVIMHKWKQRG